MKNKKKSNDDYSNGNQDNDKHRWNSVMFATLIQDEYDSECGLWSMKHMFIRMKLIMFLSRISIPPGIMTQIMLVLGSFCKLSCDNIPSKTDYTSQENNYLEPFIIWKSSHHH